MTELNGPHAFWLVFIAMVMGMLGRHGWRTARGMVLFPEEYRKRLIEKGADHPLARRWVLGGNGGEIRAWGRALSRVAFCYMVFSFVVAGIVSILIMLDRTGFGSAAGAVVELLSKVEAGLAC